jgi:Phage integrase family
MDRYAADGTLKRLTRRAGITKRISSQSLRHSFITAALERRRPLARRQEAASHADPRTTMRYDRARQSLDRHATQSSPPSSLAPPADTDPNHRAIPSTDIARSRRLPRAGARRVRRDYRIGRERHRSRGRGRGPCRHPGRADTKTGFGANRFPTSPTQPGSTA